MGDDFSSILSAVSNTLSRAWIYLAAVGGAATGAFIQPGLSLQGRAVSVFVGLSWSIFVGPVLVAWWMPGYPADSREVGAIYYILAVSAHVVVQKVVKVIAKRAGDPFSLLKGTGGDG